MTVSERFRKRLMKQDLQHTESQRQRGFSMPVSFVSYSLYEYMRIRRKRNARAHIRLYTRVRVFNPLETENGNIRGFMTEKDVEQSLDNTVKMAGGTALSIVFIG